MPGWGCRRGAAWWGAMAGVGSGLGQHPEGTGVGGARVSGARAGQHREPGVVLGHAVSNGLAPVSLG